MKPSSAELLAVAPDLNPGVLTAALAGLPAEYFARFDLAAQAEHLRLLAKLTPSAPVHVHAVPAAGGAVVTVAAYDLPGEFSWISGAMASLGGDVRSGDVFTFAVGEAPAAPGARPAALRQRRRLGLSPDAGPVLPSPARIIDVFELAPLDRPVADWAAALEGLLRRLFAVYGQTRDGAAVRQEVNNLVAAGVRGLREVPESALSPVELRIDLDAASGKTLLVVHGQDTPAFLYCLSNALAVNGVYIDAVRIRTIGRQVADTFLVSDGAGHALTTPAAQERLRTTVIVTKQFTHFLGSAADPYRALVHFNALTERFQKDATVDSYAAFLRDPAVLHRLACVLGAGDFLWEEFIRLHYAKALPLFVPNAVETRRTGGGVAGGYAARLAAALAAAPDAEARKTVLNEFKDFESFCIDLHHLFEPRADPETMAASLTSLAEAVIGAAVGLATADLQSRFGQPRNLAGRPCTLAVLGLGKLGGRELGYASDLELLLVYSDRGTTDGPQPVPAEEYFCRLGERLKEIVVARRQGLFELDLRLRPHGNRGPLAASLDSFCTYYSAQGEALDYERQALIKMRQVAGDAALAGRVLAFRDEVLYRSREVRYEAIDELRRRQHRELAGGDRLNAKFSAGGLVDIEYAVQYLQIQHATAGPQLQTPSTRAALAALGDLGLVPPAECAALLDAHAFLSRLINALRMERGHAKDLEIPPPDTLEFVHLARRMGFRQRPGFPVAAQLRADIGAHMAYVRDFCRRRFGRGLLVTRDTGNLADVALARDMPAETVAAILQRSGFTNVGRAVYNLRQLLGQEEGERDLFCQLVVMAEPLFRAAADADMALNNWERYARAAISARALHEALLREPQQLEILISILAASQFLADVLVRNPEWFAWVLEPQELLHAKGRDTFRAELAAETAGLSQHEHMLNALRRARRRHLLRIGARDLCLQVPLTDTVRELSWLADGLLHAVLALEARQLPGADTLLAGGRLQVLALGKLGGEELNYSSDIDLLAYLDDPAGAPPASAAEVELATALLRRAIRALTAASPAGHMYRVDMRLRPFGSQGALVGRRAALEQYYATAAAPWEVQALLKARPVVGDEPRARHLLRRLLLAGVRDRRDADFLRDIHHARRHHLREAARHPEDALDVKTGPGGIRAIEFATQFLQLRHLDACPDLLETSTLGALARLVENGRLEPAAATAARDAYILLRRIEHLLQIMEDRQVHLLHRRPEVLAALGRRLRLADPSPAGVSAALDAALSASRSFFAANTAA